LIRALLVVALAVPAVAVDFGDPQDVRQVRSVVAAKFKHALNASVSHGWALCTAYAGSDDVSVVLHRAGTTWKIVAHDGGAYGKEELSKLGVPETDIAPLLKAYQ
jgi:hypothetical protein